MKRLIFILILSLILINACSKSEVSNSSNNQQIPEINVEQKCINLCLEELNKNTNLDNGPCLSQEIEEDWVCDVAHSPRQSIDNIQENQCSSYREDLTHHFVEVTPECGFIRKI